MNSEALDKCSKINYTVVLGPTGSCTPVIKSSLATSFSYGKKQKPRRDPLRWPRDVFGCVYTDFQEPEAASALKGPRAPGLPQFST